MKTLIFDFETGGLDFKKFSPLSIAAVVSNIDTGEILEEFSTLIKLPEYSVEQEALDKNGLTVAECQANGIEPEKIADKLLDLWVNHGCFLIGGQNVHFDIGYAAHWLYKIEPHKFSKLFTYRYLDTYPLIQLCLGNEKSPSGSSLKQAIQFFGIDMSDVKGGFHEALYDVIATARLLHKFRQILGAKV
jgi:DNA polymerase III epsilon subunit-like protein